jgi:hypothetical protein
MNIDVTCLACGRRMRLGAAVIDYNNVHLTAECPECARLDIKDGQAHPPTHAGTPFLRTLWKWIIGKNSVRA